MSSDNYALHLIHKYRLAVAIAVIQTNPETKSLDQHLIDLINKFNDDKIEDLDITICSDDFNENDFYDNDASQNSGTILKDFIDEKIPSSIVLENKQKYISNKVLNIAHEENQDLTNNNDIQLTLCETQTQLHINLTPDSLTNIDKTFCDSIARIHQDNIMDIDKTCENIAQIYKTQTSTDRTICRSIDEVNKTNNHSAYEMTGQIIQENMTRADFNNIENLNDIPNEKDTGPNLRQYLQGTTAFDSQATELYTLHGYTENYTHVSQSQNHNFDISDKYIKGVNKGSGNQGANENINYIPDHMNTDFSCHVKDVNLVQKISRNLDKDNNDMQVERYKFDQNTQTAIDDREIDNQFQETRVPIAIVYDTENVLPLNFKDENLVRKIRYNLEHDSVAKQIEEDDFPSNTHTNTNKDYKINDNNFQDTQVFHDSVNDNTENFSQLIDKVQNTDQIETTTQHTISLHDISRNNMENMTMQVLDFSHKKQNGSRNTDVNKVIAEDVLNDSDGSEEISQTELVPFKVMEELNRVKAYLKKNVERRMSNDSSLDSGYRSDSQGRNSQGRGRTGFQLSGNWLGQSGHCLYDHLTRCPLVTTTDEIVAEISEVLGQLIDRLHEQESYPSFLEELLDHVQFLISRVFTEEDIVLDKDEKIQRLFLLNKSIHIQKYSIDKLTDILDNAHTRLTDQQELYELTNIQETENLSYIFHILEVILKRCLKNKKINNSQTESEEILKCPKRSSISDIWRKKWNPNYKEESKIDSSLEKKCVLKKCNEVLNKIVVGCMDGYSLVAFAALQCFNLLQS